MNILFVSEAFIDEKIIFVLYFDNRGQPIAFHTNLRQRSVGIFFHYIL